MRQGGSGSFTFVLLQLRLLVGSLAELRQRFLQLVVIRKNALDGLRATVQLSATEHKFRHEDLSEEDVRDLLADVSLAEDDVELGLVGLNLVQQCDGASGFLEKLKFY